MNLSWKRALYGSLTALLLGTTACASRAEPDAATPAQAAVGADAPEAAHLNLIRQALAKVALRADQKQQVDQLAAEAAARHAPIQQARQALANALADQVQAGAIDRTTLKPRLDALQQAVEQSRPADRAALVTLHNLLDSTQRNQFVDALEAQFRGRASEGRGMQMHKWASDLNLSEQQRQQLQAAMRTEFQGKGGGGRGEWRGQAEKGKKLFESFRQDQFTIDSTFAVAPNRVERGATRFVDLAEAAVPILTPEQRAIAAQKLRALSTAAGQ
jgi:hypothetical protein